MVRCERWAKACLVALCLTGFWLGYTWSLSPAEATHTQYTGSERSYSAPISNGQAYNGYKVYLSSPTHPDSGSRGELGWDENINGRHWNIYAASSRYRNEAASTSRYRNLTSRGYNVKVSENSTNGNFMDHVTSANNWGADVYVVTHTNAGPSTADYFLVMTDKQNGTNSDRLLRSKMATILGSRVPGGNPVESTDASGYTSGINLGELGTSNSATYVVYNEVIFHTNQSHVDWFGSGGNWIEVTNNAWRYGYAIDSTLGYP